MISLATAASAAPAAQATPATAATPAAPAISHTDTIYLAAPPASTAAAPARQTDIEDLEAKRDHFAHMQGTGYNLLMGGIAAAGVGVAMMVIGINQAERSTNRYNDYSTSSESSDDGFALFFIGYLTVVGAAPPLITTGIILNRIGNHRRETYQRELDAQPHKLSLGIGLNSVRLAWSF